LFISTQATITAHGFEDKRRRADAGSIPGEPEPVPEEQIVSLRKIIESGIHLEPYPYLKEGQQVRIARGPFSGIEGILVKKNRPSPIGPFRRHPSSEHIVDYSGIRGRKDIDY